MTQGPRLRRRPVGPPALNTRGLGRVSAPALPPVDAPGRGVLLLSLMLAVIGLGCADAGAPTSTATPPVVANRVHKEGASGGVFTLVEDLRVGLDGRAAERGFQSVAAIEVGEDGSIFVLDFDTQQVSRFDSHGSPLAVFAGKGSADQQLTQAAGLSLAPDGTVWVWDYGRDRFAVYSRRGTYLKSVGRIVEGTLFPWRGGFLADGRLVDWGVRLGPKPASGGTQSISYVPAPMGQEGGPSEESIMPVEFVAPLSRGGRRIPYASNRTVAVERNGDLWLADPSVYRVHRRAPSGDTLLTFSLEVEAAAVSETQIDSILAAQLPFREGRRLQRDEIPSRLPIVRRLFSDEVYVYVMPHDAFDELGTVIDVFQHDGLFVDRVRRPIQAMFPFPAPVARAGYIYAGVQDSLGEFVSRLRLEERGG